MTDKYFNEWEFNQALDLVEIAPSLSKTMFEEYLNKYPKDYSAYLYYCSNLIILGQIEEAQKIFNYFEKIYNSDKKFQLQNKQKNEKIKETLLFTKVKLLSYQKKYEELYKLCKSNIKTIIDKEMNGVLFYAKKMTGRLNPDRRDANSYSFSQIVRYEEKDFFDHIKKHLSEYNENTIEPNSSIFEQNFPIEKVVEEIKKYVPSEKKLLWGFFDDIYFFKYDGCGRVNNKIVDYIKVVCIHDTKEFITMCPVDGSKNLPYIDLNYLVNEQELKKVKKISQIDKFNRRFIQK